MEIPAKSRHPFPRLPVLESPVVFQLSRIKSPPWPLLRNVKLPAEFRRLRFEHHCYFEYPRNLIVLPQRVGGSPFVKGMNDRNHVTNAAFIADSYRAMGFEPVGVYRNIGFKNGAWHDVLWSQRELAPRDGEPEPLR